MGKVVDPLVLIKSNGGPDVWAYNPKRKTFFCQICSADLCAERTSSLRQHMQTSKHQKNDELRKKGQAERQQLLSFPESKSMSFNEELCQLLVSCNIPFNKVENPAFVRFMEKYATMKLPSRKTLFKCLGDQRESIWRDVQRKLQGKDLFIQVDETTDPLGRAMTAILAGPLDGNFLQRPYLIDVVDIETAKNSTIQQSVLSALTKVFHDVDFDRIKLFLTDGASYCLKAGRGMRELCPNLIHLTCLAHGMNRVAELARVQYPNVNALISEVKKVFVKSAQRRKAFSSATEISLPPCPTITRWGTWLEAAFYYAENFNPVKEFIDKLEDDSQAIVKAKELMSNLNIKAELAIILANLKPIVNALKSLQERAPLVKSMEVIESVQENLQLEPFQTKLQEVLKKNPGFEQMHKISQLLRGDINAMEVASPHQMALFANAPTTTCDCERVFSLMKDVLTSKRMSLTEESVRDLLMVKWNKEKEK